MKRYSLGAVQHGHNRDGCMVEDEGGEWVKLTDLTEGGARNTVIDECLKELIEEFHRLDQGGFNFVRGLERVIALKSSPSSPQKA